MVRLRDLVPSFCIRDTALDVSTTTWKGPQALDAAWSAWQTSSQWFIGVPLKKIAACNSQTDALLGSALLRGFLSDL